MRGKAVLLVLILIVSAVSAPAAGQSAEYSGEIELIGDSASDGTQYQYDLGDDPDISDFNVSLTGVDNVVSDSASGSISSGSPESVDISTQQDPGGEITLSSDYSEETKSKSGSTRGSDITNPIDDSAVDYSDIEINLNGISDEDASFNNIITDVSRDRSKSTTVTAPGGTLKKVGYSVDEGAYQIFVDGNEITNDFDNSYKEVNVNFETGEEVDVQLSMGGAEYPADLETLNLYYDSDQSVNIDGSNVDEDGSITTSVSKSDSAISVGSFDGKLDYDLSWTQTFGVSDLSGSVGSTQISESGVLTSNITRSVDLSDGSNTINLSYSGESNALDYNLSWDETTQTTDPTVNINGETAGISGTLADGETRSLSVDPAWIDSGTNNVSISTNSPTDGPLSLVGLSYRHDAARSVSATASETQFESRYNTSYTYQDATANATASIPFDSDRVVAVHNLEYRVDGGSWQPIASDHYSFNGSEVTADLSAAKGGELDSGTTVDVRATGRKIEVDNGAVTITEATAPGDELDTEMAINSKSEDFQINVGETESGSRIHYGLSDDFGGTGPTGSAVLEANGDQHVQFPNALPGDSVRMKHLRTQVKPQSGDVRISVQEAGSDPKIDVSPGPGGAGDPVDIKYYRTQTNKEYILESLTQGIVLDSDTAESPAIFSDDDSDETWLIALGTVGGDGDTEEGEGIIGPVQQSTGIEIPFSGPVQPLIALLAIGALATVYFRGPDGFAYFSRAGGRAASATRSSIPLVGGLLGRLFSAIGTALSYGFGGLVRLAGFARSRPRLTAGVAGVASMAAVAFGVIPLPIELVFAAGVPLVSFVLLREIGQFNVTVWAVTSVAAFLGSLVALGVSFDGLINEQTSLILAVGGLYIAYQVVQVWRQGQITEVVVPGRGNDDDDV